MEQTAKAFMRDILAALPADSIERQHLAEALTLLEMHRPERRKAYKTATPRVEAFLRWILEAR